MSNSMRSQLIIVFILLTSMLLQQVKNEKKGKDEKNIIHS